MIRTSKSALVLLMAAVVLAPPLAAQSRRLKPGFNLFSKEQDVQLGKEAAAQIEREQPVVNNAQLNAYIEKVGRRLASQPEADSYPYTFKVVNDNSINAFALPGGPTFVNTGLIAAADNEAQMAGVLAHEISHVALRHGTNNVSKANFAQLALGALGAFTGGTLGQVLQLAGGLGANSLLLKFSRDAETQADLLGSQIMAKSGYNPVEMARFFEKLEAQDKQRGGAVSQFFSSHPNPGNRVKAVEKEMQTFPKRDYGFDSGGLPAAKRIVAQLPPPPAPKKTTSPPAAPAGAPGDFSQARPSSRLKQLRSQGVTLSVPENWEVFEGQQGGSTTVASRQGLAQRQGGGIEIGYGLMIGSAPSPGQGDLARDTEALLKQFAQGGAQRTGTPARQGTVNGRRALLNVLSGASMYQGQREVDMVLTAAHSGGLFYLVMIAPEGDLAQAKPVFDQIIRSIRFDQ